MSERSFLKNPIKVINDLSSSDPLPNFKQELIAEELLEIQNRNIFKSWLFWGISSAFVTTFILLITFISFRISIQSFGETIPLPERLTIIGILAAISIVLPLALLRVIYTAPKTKDDSGDSVSIWQSLFKELIDIFRKYLENKSH
ncbi:hypothetical protein [Nitrosomonas ureae]|uniref:Uncharacterized protein n=1 Tax=Nitrosomonas ureae TaxID=44577 RepID=A0A1H2HKF9_9PROT|nr:hypothetical protein [Nitrosomonas ureae]ALQ51155.1 hypothetical protein ATY38_07910 [Nitrosomonas ureae]SDU32335.1 hypothetical protein SAMN05216406_15314 [Nitrosomonas ureae]